jgi:stage III sporulation protein AG
MQTENKKEPLKHKVKKFIQDYKNLNVKKKTQYIAIVLIIAVILAIYFSSITDKAKTETQPEVVPQNNQTATNDTEQKLQETLSIIEGAGKVEVMITYKSGPEIVPAFSTDTQKTNTTDTGEDQQRTSETKNEQTDVVTIEKGGDANALILKENTPDVKGVIVIAEGAGDLSVKLNLLRAVQTILAVTPDQIEIFEMNKS